MADGPLKQKYIYIYGSGVICFKALRGHIALSSIMCETLLKALANSQSFEPESSTTQGPND